MNANADHKAAPGPYSTVDIGCGAGFHTYIVDANGRKIGVVWGPRDEKVWTAALFAGSSEALQLLQWLDRKGGLGHDVHARIAAVIDKAEGRAP